MSGGGLSLAGGAFSMSKLAKTASKVADVALPLASAMGYDTSKASRIKNVMDGGDDSVQGSGFGKATQRKIKKTVKKGAKIGEALVNEFGSASQKQKAATARKVVDTISGAGTKKPLPGQRLRALIAKGGAHF